ncbi:MAG: DUF2332 family protein [Pseudonocardiaceae bacterium]
MDLRPLNPAAPTDQKWLRALVWPDHTDRMWRLYAALTLAAQQPATIQDGPADAVLPDAVQSAPRTTSPRGWWDRCDAGQTATAGARRPECPCRHLPARR